MNGIKTKCHCRLENQRAEKEPIMLYRIADRGLLFEYFGNKMLSLYEDWREERERDTFFFYPFIFQWKLIVNIYIEATYDKHEKEKINKFQLSFLSLITVWPSFDPPFLFTTFFEFLLVCLSIQRGCVEKRRGGYLSTYAQISDLWVLFIDPFFLMKYHLICIEITQQKVFDFPIGVNWLVFPR